MEGPQGNHSVLVWNDSMGVILSWDGTTPLKTFCPGKERLRGSHSVLGWNDYGGVLCSGIKRLQGSHSVLGWNDSRGVILFCNGKTPGKSFCPGKERL